MIGFFAYMGCAIMFYALAIYAKLSKLPIGISPQASNRPKVKDIKGYNHAVCVLFAAYGTLLLLASLPLLFGKGESLALICSILCVALGTIAMFFAAIKIDDRYRSRKR